MPADSGPPGGTGRPERGLDDPIVRAAIDNVGRHLDALSASEIVQLVLFPEPLVAWATGAGVDDSQVANLFRRHRRYSRLRALLAGRLGVPITVLDHLIDAPAAVAAAKRPAAYAAVLADAGLGHWGKRPPIDWATPPYPPYRDGTNPLERLAMAVLTRVARRLRRARPAVHPRSAPDHTQRAPTVGCHRGGARAPAPDPAPHPGRVHPVGQARPVRRCRARGRTARRTADRTIGRDSRRAPTAVATHFVVRRQYRDTLAASPSSAVSRQGSRASAIPIAGSPQNSGSPQPTKVESLHNTSYT
jgi:hypothetical protein